MKKIYFLVLVLIANLTAFAAEGDRLDVTFTCGSTVTNPAVNMYSWNPGELELGSFIRIEGTYDLSHDGHDATQVKIALYDYEGWSILASYGEYEQSATSGNALTGVIDHNLVIPADLEIQAKFTSGSGTGYLIQVRVVYGEANGANGWAGETITWVNATPDIVPSSATSVKNATFSDINVYPNPAATGSIINIDGLDAIEDVKIELFNVAGSLVKSITTSDKSVQIASDVNPGLYTVYITDGNSKSVKKLLVK